MMNRLLSELLDFLESLDGSCLSDDMEDWRDEFVCKIEADELKRANTAAYEEAMKKAGGALFFT
jgi:hypothetical protein